MNGTPETRDATNRLRFVYFSINRRRGYVSFPIGFLHEENDFTQYLKIYLDIFRHIRKFLDLRKTILFCVNIRWVLSPPTTSRCTLEREDNLKNIIYNYYPYYTTQLYYSIGSLLRISRHHCKIKSKQIKKLNLLLIHR